GGKRIRRADGLDVVETGPAVVDLEPAGGDDFPKQAVRLGAGFFAAERIDQRNDGFLRRLRERGTRRSEERYERQGRSGDPARAHRMTASGDAAGASIAEGDLAPFPVLR